MSKRKFPDQPTSNPNAYICDILIELANYEKNKNRNRIKFFAYKKAAAAIAKHNQPITCGKDAKNLEGVGVKIAKKIDEILKTGKLRKLEDVRNDSENSAIQQLVRVSGIGPSHAYKLMKEGITGIEDLRKHTDKLNHQQKIGLKHFEDFEERISREEVDEMKKHIFDEIQKLDPTYKHVVCGSYRRGAKDCGDIDVLLTHPKYTSTRKEKNILCRIVDRLKKTGFITDTLSVGESTFMGVCRLADIKTQSGPSSADVKSRSNCPIYDGRFRRIDIRLIPADEYYCGLLHYTGSDLFNKGMRSLALEKGFTINEHSIRPMGSTGIPGEPIFVNSEEAIFDCIDLPFREPTARIQF